MNLFFKIFLKNDLSCDQPYFDLGTSFLSLKMQFFLSDDLINLNIMQGNHAIILESWHVTLFEVQTFCISMCRGEKSPTDKKWSLALALKLRRQ